MSSTALNGEFTTRFSVSPAIYQEKPENNYGLNPRSVSSDRRSMAAVCHLPAFCNSPAAERRSISLHSFGHDEWVRLLR
ncbi:hypothetical protein KCP73_01290 [Salmonella enterica subsp. enterica]|nr:hypothetical protein KCP73_01290 [Salmonella enterica subsp. enterica]